MIAIGRNGKQKSILQEPLIEGMSVDEFIDANADPIWLHQNKLWELMTRDDTIRLVDVEF